MPKQRKRANGEGNISKRSYTRKDGSSYDRFQASLSLGYDGTGKRKRETVYGETQNEVRQKLEALKRQIHEGNYSDSKLTVAEYLANWLNEKNPQLKPRTHEAYRYNIQKYVNPRLGKYLLSKVSTLQIQTSVTDIATNVGARTANLCRTMLFGAFKQAIRWQLLSRNPVEGTDPVKETKKEMQIWTIDEAVRFLDTTRPHRLYALFYLAMSTGMRRGELLGLRWQDVRDDLIQIRQNLTVVRNQIHISTPKTKSGQRSIAISTDVVAILKGHQRQQEAERRFLGQAWHDSDLVFTSEVGTPIHPRNLERAWYALQKETRRSWSETLESLLEQDGLAEPQREAIQKDLQKLEARTLFPKIRLHDLRHLQASLAIKQGMDAKMLAERLGHARASLTLDVYTHLFDEQRQNSAVNIRDALSMKDEDLN